MKRLFVANLREGAKVEDVFLVTSKSVSSTRAGSPYLKIRLADKTGEVDAVKWDATESEISRLREDEYVLVHATVRSYNDTPQLSLDSFKRWAEPVDPADFIKSSPHDAVRMFSEFKAIIGQISDPQLKTLLDRLFGDEKFVLKFRQAPAATRIHHAYVAGLLEHTLNVMKTCVAYADLYPHVHRDLLITGAALHDIGKIEEFEWSGTIKYSDVGHMVGHIVRGAMLVKEVADSIDGFDPLMSLALQHMIIAHHGNLEYGSPKLPQSIEAVMLHMADDMDAQVAIFAQAIADSDESGDEGLFTKRHYLLDRPIFKGVDRGQTRPHPEDDGNGNGNGKDGGVLDLFAVDFDPFVD